MELTEEISGVKVAEKSLSTFIYDWLKEKAPTVASSTLDSYRTVTKAFSDFMIAEGFADQDIAAITRDHVTSYRNHISKLKASKTVNRHVKMIRTLFKAALEDNLLSENPAEFVKSVRNSTEKERRPFTIPEINAILSVADEEWRSLIKFGLYTGQRLGDLARLTWHNVDLQREEIRLVTKKSGKPLCIPIAKPLLDHIEKLPVSDNPDQPIHSRSHETFMRKGQVGPLSNEFANLLFSAGLRESKVSHRKKETKEQGAQRMVHALSFHCLRHTAVTVLHEAGVPQAVVQQMIGHDSKSVHNGYIGVGREALIDAAQKFPNLA